MELNEFTAEVEKLGWHWAEFTCDVGPQKGKKGILVRATDRQAWVEEKGSFEPIMNHITFKAIKKMKEFGQFTRQFPNVIHVTRIVGYYSQVHNWNPAKMRELTDRHKGQYGVQHQEAGRNIDGSIKE